MCRRVDPALIVLLCGAMALTGCQPQQPFYFHEDGDLSHYVDKATDIEYPDTQTCSLDDVTNAEPPLTLENPAPRQMWDLTLQEAVKTAMENGKILRSLGGRYISQAGLRAQTGEAPDTLLTRPDATSSVYDPAIVESAPFGGVGQIQAPGVESALAAFDAQFTSNLFWNHNDRQQNVGGGQFQQFFVRVFEQDQSTFQNAITKVTATGGQFAMRSNTTYDANNNPTRQVYSDWNQNFEMVFNQPLLSGSGVQYNRIAGPNSPFTGQGTPQFDGVMLARINTDLSLADFEIGVRNMVSDTENAYWELYFAYRNLEASKAGRASALQTWQKVHALYKEGSKGGELDKEAQAREQYFSFRSQVQQALNDLYRGENRLRYMMGLSVSDGRLIRPADEPTTAKVSFDWYEVHAESLMRSAELRKQKWRIKERELELIAARSLLQPRLDATGTYRWLGLGDDLLSSSRSPVNNGLVGTNAFQQLTSGQYQEWQLGLQAQIPIGFRRELSGIRHYQLQLARERSRLQDQELEVSHEMGDAIRNLEGNYDLAQSNFNRRVAAEKQVEAVKAAFEADTVTLDLLLDAQRRRADAEIAYYRSLVDYMRGVAQVHYRKGSLLEYNGVYLAEGPWPNKAYFDAERMARQRDASYYLDYGYTRPKVISQGSYLQNSKDAGVSDGDAEAMLQMPGEGMPQQEIIDGGMSPEEVPTPMPGNAPEAMPVPTSQGPMQKGMPSMRPTNSQPGRATRPIRGPTQHAGGPVLQQPTMVPAQAAAGDNFDWGTLGLDAPKPQSRVVNKTSASTSVPSSKQKPAASPVPSSVKRASAVEINSESKPVESKPVVDSKVQKAGYLEWQSKADRATQSAETGDSGNASAAVWKPARR